MTDRYQRYKPEIGSVAFEAFEITPDDSNDLTQTAKALYIGGAGTLKVETKGYDGSNSTINFVGLSAGYVLPVSVKRIYSTNTTCTGIVGLY